MYSESTFNFVGRCFSSWSCVPCGVFLRYARARNAHLPLVNSAFSPFASLEILSQIPAVLFCFVFQFVVVCALWVFSALRSQSLQCIKKTSGVGCKPSSVPLGPPRVDCAQPFLGGAAFVINLCTMLSHRLKHSTPRHRASNPTYCRYT